MASVVINTLTYNGIIKEDIKNISKLSSTNIYSEINNELIKPIFVSLTMANDSFLKKWLVDEQEGKASEEDLLTYLNGFYEKYGYNSVFLVSEGTKDYYHYQGLHKTVSDTDNHDQWYFEFVDQDIAYSLDVDNDEAAGNELTVFVNCRIENDQGDLLGVAGVGLRMNQVQKNSWYF